MSSSHRGWLLAGFAAAGVGIAVAAYFLTRPREVRERARVRCPRRWRVRPDDLVSARPRRSQPRSAATTREKGKDAVFPRLEPVKVTESREAAGADSGTPALTRNRLVDVLGTIHDALRASMVRFLDPFARAPRLVTPPRGLRPQETIRAVVHEGEPGASEELQARLVAFFAQSMKAAESKAYAMHGTSERIVTAAMRQYADDPSVRRAVERLSSLVRCDALGRHGVARTLSALARGPSRHPAPCLAAARDSSPSSNGSTPDAHESVAVPEDMTVDRIVQILQATVQLTSKLLEEVVAAICAENGLERAELLRVSGQLGRAAVGRAMAPPPS